MPRLLLVPTLLLLGACEGTWATPSIFAVSAVNNSQIEGLAMASMVCTDVDTRPQAFNRVCQSYGTSIEVQFQTVHDPRPYIVVFERGTCTHPHVAVTRVALTATESNRDGAMAFTIFHKPIHSVLHDGYSVALVDKRISREVACGNLQSDRVW